MILIVYIFYNWLLVQLLVQTCPTPQLFPPHHFSATIGVKKCLFQGSPESSSAQVLRSAGSYVIVTCPWVGSASWWLNEWYPQPRQPCSAPVDSCLWLLLCSQSAYLFFLFSCCLLFSPALLFFPKNPSFSSCAQSRTVLHYYRPPLWFFTWNNFYFIASFVK